MARDRKISDADLARLRALRAVGWSLQALADKFGISRQHVGRLVRGEQRPVIAGLDREALCDGVSNAMNAFLSGVELDAGVAVLAVTAQALAVKLDECVQSDSATAAQAVPRIASQLVDVIDRLRGAVPQEMDSLDRLRQRREARLLAMAVANRNGTGERPLRPQAP